MKKLIGVKMEPQDIQDYKEIAKRLNRKPSALIREASIEYLEYLKTYSQADMEVLK